MCLENFVRARRNDVWEKSAEENSGVREGEREFKKTTKETQNEKLHNILSSA
jgi:hypothetical protein